MRRYSKALVNLMVAAVIFFCTVWLLPKAFVFFSPFVVGWVIALIAGPLVRFFEEKIKLKRKIGSAFVIIVVIGLVVVLLYGICAQLLDQMLGLVGALPQMWEGMSADLADINSRMKVLLGRFDLDARFDLDDIAQEVGVYVGDFLGKISSPTIEAAGNFARRLPSIFIGVIMALLSAYFLWQRDSSSTTGAVSTPRPLFRRAIA